jgi:hypothetical protein
VLSVPKRIRPFFHHDPALAGAVLQVLLRAVRTALRRGSPGAGPDAQIGAVSFQPPPPRSEAPNPTRSTASFAQNPLTRR